MKIRVQMKDPDTLTDAIEDAVKDDLAKIPGLDAEDRKALAKRRAEVAGEIAAEWFECGEYLMVEIDTEARTCVVVPRKDAGR